MTDHLPECWKNLCETCDSDACPPCICTPLRACEQRAQAACALKDQDLYAKGYSAGLDAAEAAVTAMPEEYYGDGIGRETTFAAIRALKEDK